MKLYLWESVGHATESYHDGGGIVVVAPDLAMSRDLIRKNCPAECGALTTEPDAVWDVNDDQPRLFLFPDAGCC